MKRAFVVLWLAVLLVASAEAGAGKVTQDTLLFSAGKPDYKIATASRPYDEQLYLTKIESADDFALDYDYDITGAKFVGLVSDYLLGGEGYNYEDKEATLKELYTHIKSVVVEFYLIFPLLSNETVPERLIANSATNGTDKVVARLNSPSDEALFTREDVTYEVKLVKQGASVPLYISNNQIKPKPNQQQKLSGFTGTAVEFSVKFPAVPFPAGKHWFFVPQVGFDCKDDCDFLWLSAPIPIAAGGKGFPDGVTDLQSWIRNEPGLAPDWERIGSDVVGSSYSATFNAAFDLYGVEASGYYPPGYSPSDSPGYSPPVAYSPPPTPYSPPEEVYYPPPADEYSPPAEDYTPPAEEYSPPADEYSPPAKEYYPPPAAYASAANPY